MFVSKFEEKDDLSVFEVKFLLQVLRFDTVDESYVLFVRSKIRKLDLVLLDLETKVVAHSSNGFIILLKIDAYW